jgi:hypothetical protein
VPDEAPSELTKEQLKSYAESILVRQGNNFIKELLKKHKVKIGATKADFLANIRAAIDEGVLTQQVIETWLLEVEGWGNQHIYLYTPPGIGAASIRGRIEASPHGGLLGTPVSWEFPEELVLTSILVAKDHLSLAWHCASAGWERTPSKDFQQDEDDARYEYRAYRQRFDRSVVRFEWRFRDAFCSILIQLPHEGTLHVDTKDHVARDLLELGLIDRDLIPVSLSQSVKAAGRAKDVVVRSTKMMAQGGHVDFVATQEDGIAGVRAVREVRRAVNEKLFASADGMFSFTDDVHKRLSRAIKVQVFGGESRIKIWAQCTRKDVYLILANLWAKNRQRTKSLQSGAGGPPSAP